MKNISFQKYVFVRFTCNNWQSYKDIAAHFVLASKYSMPLSSQARIMSSSSSNNLDLFNEFDTFRFEFELPVNINNSPTGMIAVQNNNNKSNSIQFCICFRVGQNADVQEYWDNNDGKNYEIVQYITGVELKAPPDRNLDSNKCYY